MQACFASVRFFQVLSCLRQHQQQQHKAALAVLWAVFVPAHGRALQRVQGQGHQAGSSTRRCACSTTADMQR